MKESMNKSHLGSKRLDPEASSRFTKQIAYNLCLNHFNLKEFAIAMSETVNTVKDWLSGDYIFTFDQVDKIQSKLQMASLPIHKSYEHPASCNKDVIYERYQTQCNIYQKIFLHIQNKLENTNA